MKVLGLIAEYNPFHNGHLYHLKQSKAVSGANAVVCVLSGNFVQRGEPAVVNKWARTEMALLAGADLVIELPFVYAMASAEFFAFGAVKLLDSLKIVDCFCFGSESGSVDELDQIACILQQETDLYKSILKEYLDMGWSYPSSREAAVRRYVDQTSGVSIAEGSIMSSSNNILGIEYLKALRKIKSNMLPLTISRVCNTYDTACITGAISSAHAIRRHIYSSKNLLDDETLKNIVPETSFEILTDEFRCGRGPIEACDFETAIITFIRSMSAEQLKSAPYVSEGLENRISDAADNSGTLEELIGNICTKRYTRTRIQRSLFSIPVGVTSKELDEFNMNGGPRYVRILGFNKTGRQLLSQINNTATLPVIVKTADFINSSDMMLRRMLEIESMATDIYVLAYKNPIFRKAGQDFTQNVVRID